MDILSEHINSLLHRRDVVVTLESPSNPGLVAVASQLADHFKSSADAIAVKTVKGSYGTQTLTVTASIYDSAASKVRIEQKPKAKKEKKI
jgi:ribosomal protein S24E